MRGRLTLKTKADLQIDRVERIDSTWLKIDRLDFSRFCRSTRLGWKSIDSIKSLPTVYRPIHFYAAQLQLSSVFFIVMSVCLSQPWTVLMVTRQLADMQIREITWSLCKNDWRDRVAIWRVDWPRPVSFCVRWVSHPKSAVHDEGHSWSLNILLPYVSQMVQVDAWSK